MSYKANSICLKFSLFIPVLLFLQLCQAQRIQKNVKIYGTERFTGLDELLMRNQKLLGGNVVGMVWKDTIVYKREIGDFTAQTVAPLASSSKWLTAALVMQFVDEGKISLEDKVSKYIPIFASYNKN